MRERGLRTIARLCKQADDKADAGRCDRLRRWEIDCLRGLAVGLMVVSNFLFDLIFFAGHTQLQSALLDWFARFIAGLFIVLAGISLTLSQARQPAPPALASHAKGINPGDARRCGSPSRPGFSWDTGFGKHLRRGLQLLGLGVVVSVATRIAAGNEMVLFGVLHLIGAGVILVYPFLGRPGLSLAGGLLVLAAAPVTSHIRLDHPWLLWLGLQPHNYGSVDYAPLIPWFGFMLLGVFVGHMIYPGGQPRWPLPDGSRWWLARPLAWCGRRSLPIYFLHQPILLAGLTLSRQWW